MLRTLQPLFQGGPCKFTNLEVLGASSYANSHRGGVGIQIQSCMSFTEKIVVGKISFKVMHSFKVIPVIY